MNAHSPPDASGENTILQQENRRLRKEIARLKARPVPRTDSAPAHREAAARLDALSRTMADGLITLDASGRIDSVNPAAARIFGYEPEDLVGQDVRMLLPDTVPGSAHEADGAFAARLARAEHGQRRDGTVFPVEIAVGEARLGHRLLYTCVVRDLSERKQIEELLSFLAEAGTVLSSSLDYEKTLRSVAELAVPRLADWCAVDLVNSIVGVERVAVAHVDPAKVRWAHELQKRYPFDPDALHGTPKVIRTGEPEFYPEVTDDILIARARSKEHLRMMRQVGFRSVIVVPMPARGETLGTLTLVWSDSRRRYTPRDLEFAEQLARRAAIAVDNARLFRIAQNAERMLKQHNESLETRVAERTAELTAANERLRQEVCERERAQRALARLNLDLEQRNRELQDFTYVATHDLKEPLRKIQTFADLVRTEYGARLGDTGADYMRRMQNAARRISTLIDDLLAFSDVTAKGGPFRKVNLSRVAAEVVQSLDVHIQEAGGCVELGPLPEVGADPAQMRQLLRNLIGNALKFRRESEPPRVVIRAEVDGASASSPLGAMIRLSVTDNCIGFEQKYADRIFSPFQRLHGGEAYTGTGMGLAICRRIVERHGGTISVSSTPGEGSTFTVTLPVDQAPDVAQIEG